METKQDNIDKEYTLAYQKWDGYIQKQHLKGDELQDLEESLYFNKKSFIRYFSMIDAMINRNSSYVSDYDAIKDEMKKIRTLILSKPFIDGIIKDSIKMRNSGIDFVTPDEEYKVHVDEVKEIFRQVQIDFVKRGINPEPKEIAESTQNNGGKKID